MKKKRWAYLQFSEYVIDEGRIPSERRSLDALDARRHLPLIADIQLKIPMIIL